VSLVAAQPARGRLGRLATPLVGLGCPPDLSTNFPLRSTFPPHHRSLKLHPAGSQETIAQTIIGTVLVVASIISAVTNVLSDAP
jgi:hypothetical protein